MTALTFTRHAPIHAFTRIGDDLAISGVPLTRLAQRVGRTPFYAYSRDAITARMTALRASLPDGVEIHYALKANPMPAVVGHLAGITDGMDVASAAEMHVALDAGVDPATISFAGPGKTDPELAQAIAAGIAINLESEGQYARSIAIGDRLGIAPRLAVRVNPDFELKSSGMRMSGGAKPFGVDQARVPDLLARMAADGIVPVGLHVFSGSQSLQATAIAEAQRQAVALAISLSGHLRRPLEWLNIGGGFGVPYFAGETALDLGPIADTLEQACGDARRQLAAPLVLELGRYLVAEAGIYVSRVIDRKESGGQTFLVVDGGMHHNLAASGNFGQVIRKNYPVAIGNRLGQGPETTQTVVGPLCTPLDLLADRMALPEARIGDLVVVFMAGAYGRTASPSAFLSHPDAAEVLV